MVAGADSGNAPEPPSLERRNAINPKLFVGNLSFQTTQGELERLFGEVGEIRSVFLPTDRDSGRPRGFAFVEFADGLTAAAAAQRFDGYELDGRNIRVNEAQEKSQRSSGFSPGGPRTGPPPHRPKSKGSRRNLRARKRSL
jgi:RNA recognition motif-containing protein